MAVPRRLSQKSATVLALIAQGHSYSQIADSIPGISYLHIFKAAEEALQLADSPPHPDYQDRLAQIKSQYHRAYEPWTADEDQELQSMYQQRIPIRQIAQRLQRQSSAIQSRLAKAGLDAQAGRSSDC